MRFAIYDLRLIALAAAVALTSLSDAADWPTARGNPQRTGTIDNKPGPKTPQVLWVYDSTEHFIASPVIADNMLLVSGLGAFNTASFQALSLDPAAKQREVWSKKPPYLKLAVVCSPAVAGGKIVFGDGMHQTDGATLHCLSLAGTPQWQLAEPGSLVHLESGPTIIDGKAIIGGGAAGVICVDMSRVTLDGKEQPAAAVQAAIDKKWQEMMARYEAEKKKDPDFAIPPSEDQLPRPAPVLLWQAGKGKWHVDSPIAAVNEQVLAASAALDVEKVGDRALFCLDPANGQTRWRTPLTHNPWAGPTVAGDLVLVGCSNIRFEPKDIKNGQGEIVAMKLSDGQIAWRKPVPGGVVASIAVSGEMAVFTATDGKVRAVALKDGTDKWTYDARAPFFAAPAVGPDAVYVADLKGVVHAINLATGEFQWRVNIATNPATKAPGMIYGSPVLHDGRVYVATSNLESGPNQQKTVVICIGQ